MKLNKNIIIAILLLSIFAVGTMNLCDTVAAATWKKFDSGSYTDPNPEPGYKKTVTYVAYMKGSDMILLDSYVYKVNNNKKVHCERMGIGKKSHNIIVFFTIDYFNGKKRNIGSAKYPSAISFYKAVMKKTSNLRSSYLS